MAVDVGTSMTLAPTDMSPMFICVSQDASGHPLSGPPCMLSTILSRAGSLFFFLLSYNGNVAHKS